MGELVVQVMFFKGMHNGDLSVLCSPKHRSEQRNFSSPARILG